MITKTLTHEGVLNILPERYYSAHKGNFGRVLLLCGSKGYTGAAALCALGALRSGAGLVYLGVPESIYEIEACKLLEPVVFPLPEDNGMLSANAVNLLSNILPQMDAVVMGCGLGQSEGVLAVIKHVLMNFDGVVVLDADGINVMKDHKDILRGRSQQTILTPHEGEFARFSQSDINSERLERACTLANELGVIVVLKGYQTITTDGDVSYINPTGNPGMAVGGSGDVLAGMIGAFVGQQIPPLEAAACAVWLHGAAGDICAKELGQYGMLPSDMLQRLPRLMK